MTEHIELEQDFLVAEEKLIKALNKLDGVVGGTLENFSKIKKQLAEKQGQEQPILDNKAILALQEENKKLRKEKEETQKLFANEKSKNEKLIKLKSDVSSRIESLIGQLEKAVA